MFFKIHVLKKFAHRKTAAIVATVVVRIRLKVIYEGWQPLFNGYYYVRSREMSSVSIVALVTSTTPGPSLWKEGIFMTLV